jgi:hypothetical protein
MLTEPRPEQRAKAAVDPYPSFSHVHIRANPRLQKGGLTLAAPRSDRTQCPRTASRTAQRLPRVRRLADLQGVISSHRPAEGQVGRVLYRLAQPSRAQRAPRSSDVAEPTLDEDSNGFSRLRLPLREPDREAAGKMADDPTLKLGDSVHVDDHPVADQPTFLAQ